jgi:L-ascorbate metabolism protein UlaG (beta-lactamase superfamily)
MPPTAALTDNIIRHLSHSSFLLKLDGLVMVLDYYRDPSNLPEDAGLETGVVRPEVLVAEEVYVLASHGHQDHFHPSLYDWHAQIPHLYYIFSYDIPGPPPEATVLRPGEQKTVGRLRVRAYSSTDQGLAYSIYIGGRHLYFSGDNAFWNWDGDLDDAIYHQIALDEIDRHTPMDIAFQVCDPRLDGMGDGGIHIFARTFQPRLLVPMHAFGNYEFNGVVERRLREEGFVNRFWCIKQPGETIPV